ncbi:hypothetical protein BDV25DRAFT_149738 [Aspergillus avenaceus]|uniref:PHD-type domain-containing protein n=1 Tax=Aspergillus avenaceus TaxID=36643 RepID=A0A5N6U3P5_ASPAV|nr:hypothetical protein BDV25DRAFT_149738 [Aspergillus avenaceus]
MSQQHGVLPTSASIETAPPSHGSISTSSRSPAVPDLSSKPRSTSTISSRVHIPKLSPATTELLARVTGQRKGAQPGNDTRFIPWTPPGNQGKMKSSSTIIELPTPPFVRSSQISAPAASQHSTAAASAANAVFTSTSTLSGHNGRHSGLVSIAPKPVNLAPASQSPYPPQVHLPPCSAPATAPSPALRTLAPASPVPQPQPTPAPAKDSPPSAQRKKAATASRQRKSTTNTKRKRRRRDSDGDDVIRAGDSSTDESDVAPTATQTKSGRQVNRPSLYAPPASPAKDSNSLDTSDNTRRPPARKRKRVYRRPKDGSASCIHCQRGHGPANNAIVFCDECNGAWHQLCHDPPIEAAVVLLKKQWFCQECRPVPITIVQPTVVRSNPETTGPPVHAPLAPPKLQVGGEAFSEDERRNFLSGLSHVSLVELLVTLSEKHPTTPMFPENLQTLQSQFSFRPTPPDTQPNDPTDHRKVLTPDYLPTPSSAPQTQPEISDYDLEDHRLYPRAGNGFRFSLDAGDVDIMREDASCRTFSYSLHGVARARAHANQAPVWGPMY